MYRFYCGMLLLFLLLLGTSLAAQDCSQDTIPPVPLAINGVVITLEQDSTAVISAAEFNGGSTDNCTEDLVYRVQILHRTHGTAVVESVVADLDLPATTIIRLWVGDEAGNWAFCDTYLLIFPCTEGQNTDFNGTRALDVQLAGPDDTIIVSGYDFLLEEPESCGPFEEVTIARGSIPYSVVPLDTFTSTLTFTAADIGTQQVTIADYGPNSAYVFHAYVTVRDENGTGGECSLDETAPLIDKTWKGHQVAITPATNPVIINAADLFYFTADNCTPNENLQYRVGRISETTGELPPFDTLQLEYDPGAPFPVSNLILELWVGDEAGNWNSWETYLAIQNELVQDRLTFGGSAFFDLDTDCEQDPTETPWIGLPLEAYVLQDGLPVGDGEPILSVASSTGNYEFILNFAGDTLTSINTQTIFLADTTNLQLLVSSPLALNTGCTTSYLVDVNAHWPTGLNDLDMAMQLIPDCTSPYVDIGAPFLRRCVGESTYTVSYANYGAEPSLDSYIEIEFDDALTVQSSSIPWSIITDNTYTFPIGTLAPGSFGSFTVNVQVSCDAVLGETHCTEARIFPDVLCQEDNYTGPSIEVSALCNEDEEEVQLRIENVGQQDMVTARQYIVVEDVIMLEAGDFTLPAGEAAVINVPANGSTYRIEATQVSGHPGFSFPSAAIEGCGTNEEGFFSLGFINQFPQDEFNPNVAIDCQSNIGSFDPNDKTGYPLGVGEEHLIRPNVDLDYRIRFQNTGTDTAFNVYIQDTLSPFLNPASISTGAASHPYTFQLLEGNVLEFRFPNIRLPDSTTNLAASQGFVQFSVKQLVNNPIGTLIENEASIYFDLNEPIVTNTTQHRVEEAIVIVDVEKAFTGTEEITVYPNPSTERVFFRWSFFSEGKLELYRADGQLVREQDFAGYDTTLDLIGLQSGPYYFRLINSKQQQYSGTIIVIL